MHALHQHRADVVVHGAMAFDEELRPQRSGYRNVYRTRVEERFGGNIWGSVAGNTMMFRRSVLDDCDWTSRPSPQMSDHPFYHDELVRLIGLVRGRTVRIPDRLLIYRQHGANLAGAPRTLASGLRNYLGHAASFAVPRRSGEGVGGLFPCPCGRSLQSPSGGLLHRRCRPHEPTL